MQCQLPSLYTKSYKSHTLHTVSVHHQRHFSEWLGLVGLGLGLVLGLGLGLLLVIGWG